MTGAYCHSCGAPLTPDARFCKACGTPRRAPTVQHEHPTKDATAQLPHLQAAPSLASGAKRSWPIVAAAAGAFVVVTSAVVALILTSGAGSGVRAATPTVTTPAAGAGASESEAERAPSSSTPSGGTPTPTSLGLSAYTRGSISAEIPAGWATVEDEAHKTGYIESKWRDPAIPGDTVLIDTSPSTPGTLEQDAAPVHEALAKQSGYQELFYGAGDLAEVQSWKWVFRIEGDQRVDYFFNRCASGYAVLGSTPPSHFARLEATFKAVAASVHPTSEPQC